jgi:hypothetical protein
MYILKKWRKDNIGDDIDHGDYIDDDDNIDDEDNIDSRIMCTRTVI